jgi:hypothetical protein
MQIDAVAGGETNEVSFHWLMPVLAAGTYRISVAICDGTLSDFTVCDYLEDVVEVVVCDYLEDVVEVVVTEHAASISGYLKLPCSSVDLHSHQ